MTTRTKRALFAAAMAGCMMAARGADDAFEGEARAAYHATLGRLDAAHRLDDDQLAVARVRDISRRLARVAAQRYPATVAWNWEVHATSDPSITAFCMAGGKMLVGTRFVARLQLNDAELAMLLAHEMAHALAGHRRERAPSGGMEDAAAWENQQASLAFAQESEADRLGLSLAYEAGFPLAGLVGFFDKLAADEPAGAFHSTHPSAAARAHQVRAWAAELPAK